MRNEAGGFFGNDWSVSHQIERINEFVTLESMLAAKTIGIRTLLNLLALKRSGSNAAAGNHFALVNARANAGRKPGIDLRNCMSVSVSVTLSRGAFRRRRQATGELSFEGISNGSCGKGSANYPRTLFGARTTSLRLARPTLWLWKRLAPRKQRTPSRVKRSVEAKPRHRLTVRECRGRLIRFARACRPGRSWW